MTGTRAVRALGRGRGHALASRSSASQCPVRAPSGLADLGASAARAADDKADDKAEETQTPGGEPHPATFEPPSAAQDSDAGFVDCTDALLEPAKSSALAVLAVLQDDDSRPDSPDSSSGYWSCDSSAVASDGDVRPSAGTSAATTTSWTNADFGADDVWGEREVYASGRWPSRAISPFLTVWSPITEDDALLDRVMLRMLEPPAPSPVPSEPPSFFGDVDLVLQVLPPHAATVEVPMYHMTSASPVASLTCPPSPRPYCSLDPREVDEQARTAAPSANALYPDPEAPLPLPLPLRLRQDVVRVSNGMSWGLYSAWYPMPTVEEAEVMAEILAREQELIHRNAAAKRAARFARYGRNHGHKPGRHPNRRNN